MTLKAQAWLLVLLSVPPAWGIGAMGLAESGEPLEIASTVCQVEVSERLAITHLDQVFVNPTGQQITGVYELALPSGAVLTDVAVWVDDTRVKAVVRERNAARRAYQDMVHQGSAPALVDELADGIFRLSLNSIPASGTRRIELEYLQVLEERDGGLAYILPLVSDRPAAPRLGLLSVTARVHSKEPFALAVSPAYEPLTQIEPTSPDTVAEVRCADELLTPTSDWVLTIGPVGSRSGPALLAAPSSAYELGHFAVWLAPPPALASGAATPRRVEFLVDVSTSMAGGRLAVATGALEEALGDLSPGDTFNLVAFSNQARAFHSDPVPADSGSVDQAAAFLAGLQAQGGTNLEEGLRLALTSTSASSPPTLVLLTDGVPNLGLTNPADLTRLAAELAGQAVELHLFALGPDVAGSYLNGLAAAFGGSGTPVADGQDLRAPLHRLLARLTLPAWELEPPTFSGLMVQDLVSVPSQRVRDGEQVLLVGRYAAGGEGTVRLEGRIDGEAVSVDYPLILPGSGAGSDSVGDESILFDDDFEDGRADGLIPDHGFPGVWGVVDGAYTVSQVDGQAYAALDVDASTYTIAIRLRFGGMEGKVVYLVEDPSAGTYGCRLDLMADTGNARLISQAGMWSTPMGIEPNRWYDVCVQVGEDWVSAWVDGVQTHDHLPLGPVAPSGRIALGSYGPYHHTEFEYLRVYRGAVDPVAAAGTGTTPATAEATTATRLWATCQATMLETEMAQAGDPPELLSRLLELGLSYRLVTRCTAFYLPAAGAGIPAAEGLSLSGDTAVLEPDDPAASEGDRAALPALLPNAPNPFNGETVIRFHVPTEAGAIPTDLDLINLAGQRVRSWSFERLTPGDQAVVWDGRDSDGRPAASGVYLCRLQVGEHFTCRRLALLR